MVLSFDNKMGPDIQWWRDQAITISSEGTIVKFRVLCTAFGGSHVALGHQKGTEMAAMIAVRILSMSTHLSS